MNVCSTPMQCNGSIVHSDHSAGMWTSINVAVKV